jgi:hypothetical protein
MVLERGSARRGLNERSSLVRAHAPLHFMATVGARRLRAEMRVDETVDSESAILISARRPLAKGVRGMLFLQVFANRRFSRGVLLWVFVCVPTLGIGDALFDSLMACAQLTSDTARLTCFDREIAEIRKRNPQPPASVAPTAEQKFGLSNKQVLDLGATPGQAPTPTPTATKLHAHIASVSQYPIERQVFVLDNGQTWQQIELDLDFAVRMGQEVTISKGALGSFWLSTDSHRATRVKRIQ